MPAVCRRDLVAASSSGGHMVQIRRQSPSRDALQRIPMREPLRGTKAHVEDLLQASADAATLVEQLNG